MSNRILLVRVPAQEAADGRRLRDYILESLAKGVLVLTEDSALEVMELPALGGMELEPLPLPEPEAREPDPPGAPESETKPMNVELHGGRGAKEKRMIQERLIAYRKEHGLGCWAAVTKASGGKLDDETLRRMTTGAAVLPLAAWRLAARALDKLEEKEG